MSDVFRHRKEFQKPRFYPIVTAELTEVGDLMYWDSTLLKARPVFVFAFGSSLGETQKKVAPLFLGMSNDRSKVDEDDDIEIQANGIKEYPCASATWEIGDLVGIDDNAGGTALTDQQVIAVTNPDKTIGKVAKRESSAVETVQIELFPKRLEQPQNEPFVCEHTVTTDEDTAGVVDLDTGWGVSPGLIKVDVKNVNNANESHDFVITKLTGGDLGKVRIADGYSTALDATDILSVVVYQYANS